MKAAIAKRRAWHREALRAQPNGDALHNLARLEARIKLSNEREIVAQQVQRDDVGVRVARNVVTVRLHNELKMHLGSDTLVPGLENIS